MSKNEMKEMVEIFMVLVLNISKDKFLFPDLQMT